MNILDRPGPRRLRFGSFELDPATVELWNGGLPVKLQPQPAKVLAILAGRPGELVSREQLQEQVWGSTVVDFDQGLNSAIRQIRNALGDSAETPFYVETVPRRGYRFIAQVEPVLAPPVLSPGRGSRLRAAVFAASAVILAGLSLLGLLLRSPARPPSPPRVRLAVLPFLNLSSDPEQDYFSDGLTEELITELSRLDPRQLGVVARTSAMRYKATKKSVDQIGQELGADYVLEGSVRRGEHGLRISAQLILVRDQTHLWAESYDRQFSDVLEIQREVSERVATALVPELLPEAKSMVARRSGHEPAPAARDAYLKGRYYLHKQTPESPKKALEQFEQATTLDPLYAEAHVGQAEALTALVQLEPGALERARAEAHTALSLDPGLAEAHLAQGTVLLYFDWDWTASLQEYRRAIELAPGLASAYNMYANALSVLGQHEAALAEVQRAIDLDPVASGVSGDLSWIYFYARRFEDAAAQARKTLELEPSDLSAQVCLLHSSVQLGRPGDAIAPAQALLRLKGATDEEVAALGRGDPAAGMRAYYEWNLRWFLPRVERGEASSFALVLLYIRLGRRDEALAWLQKAFEQRAPFLAYLGVEPRYDSLRGDPRFEELVRRLGLPEAGSVSSGDPARARS
jgi:TolB-like protein/DNA-binding winged helix-turn-helix (wHTH) protein/Tfp pilus assembly protein PilF